MSIRLRIGLLLAPFIALVVAASLGALSLAAFLWASTIWVLAVSGPFCRWRDNAGFSLYDRLFIVAKMSRTWMRLAAVPHPSGRQLALAVSPMLVFGLVSFGLGATGVSLETSPSPPANPSTVDVVLRPAVAANAGSSVPAPTRRPTDAVTVEVRRNPGFAWPVAGTFGRAPNQDYSDGIEIGAAPGKISPVWAVAAGVIEYVGAEDCCEGQEYVVVRHDEHLATLYRNLSSTSLPAGRLVYKGTVVGAVGSLGKGGPNVLHFEVAQDGRLVDPTLFLPPADFGLASIDKTVASCPGEPIAVDPWSTVTLSFASHDIADHFIRSATLYTRDGLPVPELKSEPWSSLDLSLTIPPVVGQSLILDVLLDGNRDSVELECELSVGQVTTIPPYRPPDSAEEAFLNRALGQCRANARNDAQLAACERYRVQPTATATPPPPTAAASPSPTASASPSPTETALPSPTGTPTPLTTRTPTRTATPPAVSPTKTTVATRTALPGVPITATERPR